MRFPERRFTLALLRRAVGLWIGVRLLVALAGGGGAMAGRFLPLTPHASGLVVLLVGFLCLIDTRRRNEHVLLANFGVPQSILTGISLFPALIAEVTTWLLSVL